MVKVVFCVISSNFQIVGEQQRIKDMLQQQQDQLQQESDRVREEEEQRVLAIQQLHHDRPNNLFITGKLRANKVCCRS